VIDTARIWNPAAYLITYVAAFLAGSAGAILIALLGLVVAEDAVWALALVFGAHIAALAAAWAANLSAPDGSRSDIPRIAGASVLLGLLVALGSLALFFGRPPVAVNLALTLLMFIAPIALGASLIAARFRGSQRTTRVDLLLTAGLVVAGFLAVALTTLGVCATGSCGA
jgi:hypothetical protein